MYKEYKSDNIYGSKQDFNIDQVCRYLQKRPQIHKERPGVGK